MGFSGFSTACGVSGDISGSFFTAGSLRSRANIDCKLFCSEGCASSAFLGGVLSAGAACVAAGAAGGNCAGSDMGAAFCLAASKPNTCANVVSEGAVTAGDSPVVAGLLCCGVFVPDFAFEAGAGFAADCVLDADFALAAGFALAGLGLVAALALAAIFGWAFACAIASTLESFLGIAFDLACAGDAVDSAEGFGATLASGLVG